MKHVAGSSCILKSPAHLAIHLTHDSTPLPWIQRGGHYCLFASQPTIDPTFVAGAWGDLGSLSCNGCCPGCSSRGSIGSRAADERIGPKGSPADDGGLTLLPLLKKEGKEFVLCLCCKDADIVVVVGDLDRFGLFCALILRRWLHIGSMDGPHREVVLEWECRVWVSELFLGGVGIGLGKVLDPVLALKLDYRQ
jgi:hypothetical protein